MTRVLVTDGHSRASLQIVRSLGRLGLDVYVSESFKLNPSFFSKYVKGTHVYPHPSNEDKFISSLVNCPAMIGLYGFIPFATSPSAIP